MRTSTGVVASIDEQISLLQEPQALLSSSSTIKRRSGRPTGITSPKLVMTEPSKLQLSQSRGYTLSPEGCASIAAAQKSTGPQPRRLPRCRGHHQENSHYQSVDLRENRDQLRSMRPGARLHVRFPAHLRSQPVPFSRKRSFWFWGFSC